ncbi:MAG: DNA-binding protein [Flavobacteriales bacterium]|nr:DNA-binding protein [Flavobacteriales bacterium]
MKHASGSAGRCHVIRLQPGDDVRRTLREWAETNSIDAASITSAVGSLTHAHLRYANRADGIMTTADLEVLSLSGTISQHGMHLHLSVGDRDGNMLGGHMLDGCLVRTTLELTVQEINGLRMLRTRDEQSGYDELEPEVK